MVHELKTDPQPFQAVLDDQKTFELRQNDRNFKIGDELHLKETVYSSAEMVKGQPLEYTGRCIAVKVTFALYGPIYGLQDGWCVMGIVRT